MITRIGGCCISIVRICTGEVHGRDRRRPSGFGEIKRVVLVPRGMVWGEIELVK